MDQRDAAIIALKSRGFDIAMSKIGSGESKIFTLIVMTPDDAKWPPTKYTSIEAMSHRLIQLANG